MKAPITKEAVALFLDMFRPDLASPSGLVYQKWNRVRGARSRDAGDVAGSLTNTGSYVVTVAGQKYLSTDVLIALHKTRHAETRKAALAVKEERV